MSGCNRALRLAMSAALATAVCSLPVAAHADSVPTLVTQATACTIYNLTITAGTPVSATSTDATSFGLTGQGTCAGDPSGSVFISGSGVTMGPATCAGFLSSEGVGSIIGAVTSGTMTFAIGGLTTAPLLVVTGSQTGLTGTVALAIAPASLEACLLGGTPVLQYTGAGVFAL